MLIAQNRAHQQIYGQHPYFTLA